MTNQISTWNEKALHAAIKSWYAEPGDRLEVPVDRYIVDIVRSDLLIEIQTRSFSSMKRKLLALTADRCVRVVYPVARDKWLVKLAEDGTSRLSRRKSPKRGRIEHVFEELVSFPRLLANPSFSVEVLLIQEEESRRHDASRAWRRKGWVTHERRLLKVVGRRRFRSPEDMAGLLPKDLAEPFTTTDLAAAMRGPRRLAGKAAYCLREMGAIAPVGKRGHAFLYVRAGPAQDDAIAPGGE
jgi:hypothetical protein